MRSDIYNFAYFFAKHYSIFFPYFALMYRAVGLIKFGASNLVSGARNHRELCLSYTLTLF